MKFKFWKKTNSTSLLQISISSRLCYIFELISTVWNSLLMYVHLCQSVRTFEAACKETSAKLVLPDAKCHWISAHLWWHTTHTHTLMNVTFWATTKAHRQSKSPLTQISVKESFESSWWYNKACGWCRFQVHTSKVYCVCKLPDKPTNRGRK